MAIAVSNLLHHVLQHGRLSLGIFAAVAVTAIDHQRGNHTGLLRLGHGISHVFAGVVGAIGAPAQNDLAIRITAGGHRGSPAFGCDTQESLLLSGGHDRVDRHIAIAGRGVLESHGHGQAASHLPVRLALHSARTNSRPAQAVGNILWGDRIEQLGGRGHAEIEYFAQKIAGNP